ncbi:hypothetical protein BDV27DRAFT_151788 [Aspergillus caelatus]|uniref:Collagen EMF1-alpha n=1 Tax=Aspergillus caelatus TaxID=61420 RepID=A0A5N7ALY7_9EURO|nr:uncharacterized protein BDV27DRAFT_151788 [Aspergillus caelatus]KAE8370934.1 hypothetical protein BDV27DRAFT_151788 [Aspergillus caelatus]
MRYSAIASVMALGLASFSVAAPVAQSFAGGQGESPAKGGGGALGPVTNAADGVTDSLGKLGLPASGVPSNEGSPDGASASRRDIESSPKDQPQPGGKESKGGALGGLIPGIVRRDNAPAEGQGQPGPEKPKGGLLGGKVVPGILRRDDPPAQGQEQSGAEKPKDGLLGLGVGPLVRRDEAPAKEPADGNPLEDVLGGSTGQA